MKWFLKVGRWELISKPFNHSHHEWASRKRLEKWVGRRKNVRETKGRNENRRKCMWWELGGSMWGSPSSCWVTTEGETGHPANPHCQVSWISWGSRGCSTFCTHPQVLRETALEWELDTSRCLALSRLSNCGHPGVSQRIPPANTLVSSAKLLTYGHRIDWGPFFL